MTADFEDQVGYGKPPKVNQFQKGRSGNPSGRPRRAPTLSDLLGKVSKQRILTNTKTGPKRMSKLEASLTQLANKAASGEMKAVRLLTQIVLQIPEAIKEKNSDQEATDARKKLLAALERYQG